MTFQNNRIMYKLSFLGLILIALNCDSKKQSNLKLPPREIEVGNLTDKEFYTVLQYDSSDKLFKYGISTTLNKKELSNIQRILEDAVSNINLTQKIKLDLNKYKRQYIAIINEAGEKEVWVNCFCQYDETWKRNIVEVHDGGKCYFNLKINLSSNRYYDFYINGEA